MPGSGQRTCASRATDQLGEVVRFPCKGIGLPELNRFAGHAGYRACCSGCPAQYHLEFTQHDHGSAGPAPSRDNLLVLYFDDLTQMEQVAAWRASLGHLPVEAENHYGPRTARLPSRTRITGGVVLTPQPLACVVDVGAMIRLGCLPTFPPDVYRSASLSDGETVATC